MPNQDINIRITLTDQVTKNLEKVSSGMRDFSRKMKETGRNLSQVGSYMNMVGAGIVAPLTLAYKTAGKFNAEIAHQLNQTKNVFNNLSVEIGKSLLPVMRQLTDRIANMVGWWKSLDQAMKDRIIQNVWNLGKNLIFLGTSFVILGNALKLLANLSMLLANLDKIVPLFTALASPVGAVAIAIVGLTMAMVKYKAVSDGILEGIEQAHNNLIPWMPKMFDVEKAKKGFDDVRTKMEELNNLRKEIMGMLSFKGANAEEPAGSFLNGFRMSIYEAGRALRDFQQLGVDVANSMTTSMQGIFSSFFDDAFAGNLKKGKDYFIGFAKSIAKIFTDLISKMIAQWIMVNVIMRGQDAVGNWLGIAGKAMSLGSGVSGVAQGASTGVFGSSNFTSVPLNMVASPYIHNGGVIRAHSGLNVGEVPLIAQSGERVLSRGQNREYEKGGKQAPAIIVIQAWDTQDIMRNRKSIEGIIINALKSNSSIRGAVKSYG